jgi:hypothetical protein
VGRVFYCRLLPLTALLLQIVLRPILQDLHFFMFFPANRPNQALYEGVTYCSITTRLNRHDQRAGAECTHHDRPFSPNRPPRMPVAAADAVRFDAHARAPCSGNGGSMSSRMTRGWQNPSILPFHGQVLRASRLFQQSAGRPLCISPERIAEYADLGTLASGSTVLQAALPWRVRLLAPILFLLDVLAADGATSPAGSPSMTVRSRMAACIMCHKATDKVCSRLPDPPAPWIPSVHY